MKGHEVGPILPKKEGKEEGVVLENGEEGGEEEEVRERRVLKDKRRKTNLPMKWNPPQALKDFE